ncbi:hypothetical protein GVAV_000788 [Gurleya vavrai]
MQSSFQTAYQSNIKPAKLSATQINSEIQFLASQIDTQFEPSLILFIIENLSKQTQHHDFITNSLQLIHKNAKYSIYNIRLLKAILKNYKGYIPLASQIISIIKTLKIENNDKVDINMEKIKVGTEVAKSNIFCVFVLENLLKILNKNIREISANIGFPEISYFIIKEMKKINFEGECDRMLNVFVGKIEKQRNYVIEERKKVKVSVFDRKKIADFESFLQKIEK